LRRVQRGALIAGVETLGSAWREYFPDEPFSKSRNIV
jgi:hypothetical protein